MVYNELTLVLSLLSLGFFGGFSHCTSMCSPFVITQISNNLQQVELKKFSNFERLKNFALLPYHFGRITTYSLIGFFSSLVAKNIDEFVGFKIFSSFLLIAAAIFFLTLLFERKSLPFKLPFLENIYSFFSKKLTFLFLNPKGFKGYILGLVLGLIPCGLLYGAFLIAAAISSPFLAMLGMFCFGIATFPSLFLSGIGGSFLIKYSGFKILTKFVIAVNAIMLFLMSIKIIIS